MPERGIYADTHPADLMQWFWMKYSLVKGRGES